MKRGIKLFAIGSLIGGFLMVGGMDFQDAVAAEQHYCEMVRIGAWPAKPELDCSKG